LYRRENNATTGSRIFQEEVIEMLWTAVAIGLIGCVFSFWLIYRHLRRVQQRERDIAY
jgi:sensor histidine kinase YesM